MTSYGRFRPLREAAWIAIVLDNEFPRTEISRDDPDQQSVFRRDRTSDERRRRCGPGREARVRYDVARAGGEIPARDGPRQARGIRGGQGYGAPGARGKRGAEGAPCRAGGQGRGFADHAEYGRLKAVSTAVMAGLVPAHPRLLKGKGRAWMPGTRPGMTNLRQSPAQPQKIPFISLSIRINGAKSPPRPRPPHPWRPAVA